MLVSSLGISHKKKKKKFLDFTWIKESLSKILSTVYKETETLNFAANSYLNIL